MVVIVKSAQIRERKEVRIILNLAERAEITFIQENLHGRAALPRDTILREVRKTVVYYYEKFWDNTNIKDYALYFYLLFGFIGLIFDETAINILTEK